MSNEIAQSDTPLRKSDFVHTPVLLNEAIAALQVKKNHWYIDATFGRGGHTAEILKRGGKVIALDADEEAIRFGRERLAIYLQNAKNSSNLDNPDLILIHENFEKLEEVITHMFTSRKITEKISGALFDFGMSSPQVEDQNRGFSFQYPEAELDMRMDTRLGVKAKDLLAVLSEKQLAELFYEQGEEQGRSIARQIALERKHAPINTVSQLTDLIEKVKAHKRQGGRSHLNPSTKVFQALRIAVNRELDVIQPGLEGAYAHLENGGRVVTISFHEGEDRIVKHLFRSWEADRRGHSIGDLVTSTPEEIAQNPRARSARLRVFEKGLKHQQTAAK